MAMTAFGTQDVPVFYRVSTDKDPSHKTIQIQSTAALVYVFTSQEGALLGVSQAPTGVWTPFIATWTFAIPFPVTVNVEIKDAASWQTLGNDTIQLFGADVFKVRITYQENIPASHGYIDAMVDGNRTIVYGQDYIGLEFSHSDVWTRGSGN